MLKEQVARIICCFAKDNVSCSMCRENTAEMPFPDCFSDIREHTDQLLNLFKVEVDKAKKQERTRLMKRGLLTEKQFLWKFYNLLQSDEDKPMKIVARIVNNEAEEARKMEKERFKSGVDKLTAIDDGDIISFRDKHTNARTEVIPVGATKLEKLSSKAQLQHTKKQLLDLMEE